MKNVNLVTKDTYLNHDVTNALIDTILEQTYSIMFTRQATYYFIMKLNGYNAKDMYKEVKHRAKLAGVDINGGVLSRETRVAEYAIINLNKLFTSIKLDKNKAESCIKEIAKIMSKNDIKYNALKDKLVQPKKPEDESADSILQESKSNGDSQESETTKKETQETTLESVIDFINNTTQENRLKLADILATAIKANAGIRKAM